MDPEAWEGQYRKWQYRDLAGTLTELSYTAADCGGDLICFFPNSGGSPAVFSQSREWSGTYGLTCDAETFGQVVTTSYSGSGSGGSGVAPCTLTVGSPGTASNARDSAYTTLTKTLTTHQTVGIGCFNTTNPFDQRASGNTSGTLTESLREEVYLYDALAAILESDPEADVEVGESCCASLSDASLTYPEVTDPVYITGTAARARIIVFGIPLAEYLVTVTLTRGEDETTVLIAAQGMVPTYYYAPLAAPGTDPYCITNVELYTP